MTPNRPTKFAHIVYRTRRFEQMLRWYETVFGAKIQYKNPGLAFLTYDDEHHRFAFANMAVLQPDGTDTQRRGAIGVDHVAYTYASLRDLLENYARLKEEDIRPYWCIRHGISASLYYADPDGNQLEFQVDSYKTSDEAVAFINEHWDANLLGVEFDPDDWLAGLRAGVVESEYLVRRVHEPESPLRGEIVNVLSLVSALTASVRTRGHAGARHLMSHQAVAAVASDPRMLRVARRALGAEPVPYRSTLFEKSGRANWLVAWGPSSQRMGPPTNPARFRHPPGLRSSGVTIPNPPACTRRGFAADDDDDLCQERELRVRRPQFSTTVDKSEGGSIIGHISSGRR